MTMWQFCQVYCSILEREPINTTKYEKKKSAAFVYTGEKKQPLKPYKTGHTVWFHLYEVLEPAKLSLGEEKSSE